MIIVVTLLAIFPPIGGNLLAETPVSSSCPFIPGSDTYVINFDTGAKICSDASLCPPTTEKNNIFIPAGKYDVSLYSYDSYPSRVGTTQPNESWFLKLFDETNTLLGTSNPIGDLADYVETATKNEMVNTNFVLSSNAVKAVAVNATYSNTTSPNSVMPICASLKKVIEPVCSDGIDNDEDGQIDFSSDTGCDNPDDDDENAAPVAVLVAPATAYKNDPITLDGVGSYDSDGTIATYVWNFGDASGITTAFPASTTPHTYTANGTYIVTLKVTDDKGVLSNEVTKTVVVSDAPVLECILDIKKTANLENAVPGDTIVYTITVKNTGTKDCTGGGVKIQDILDSKLQFVSETHSTNFSAGWHDIPFNDNNALIWNGHEMTPGTSGTITVTAKVKTPEICGDYSISNTARASSNEYHWVWVNGTSVTTAIKNTCNSVPVAILDAPATAYKNTSVTLDGIGSYDTDGTIATYIWNFGDGSAELTTTAPASTTPHTYLANDTYTIKLKVTDDKGATSTVVTKDILIKDIPTYPQCSDGKDNDGDGKIDYSIDPAVKDPGCDSPDDDDENAVPVAVLVAPATTYKNATTTLDGIGSYDTDGTVATYIWNFGDGSAELTTNAPASTTPHIFTTLGTTTVTLKVTDNKGATSTVVVKDILIKDIPTYPVCSDGKDNDGDGKIDFPLDPGCDNPDDGDENAAPVAILALDPTSAKPSVSIFNDGKASYDLDGVIVFYEWNFGDGAIATSTASTTAHTYSADNTYTVTLKVTDDKGATGVTTKSIVISTPVVPPPPSGCSGNCGGSVIIPSLIITNEVLEPGVIAGTSIVRWNTNIPADSRVVYGNSSVTSWTAGDKNYGYPKTTTTVPDLVTSHAMVISGLDTNATNYFRPLSKTSSLSATGKELVSAPKECYYLREFIKLGANNNPVEVKKLQVFLNEFEGAKLPVTGIYTQADFDAVVAFQNKYKTTIIDPWGETTRGYVYLTTKKQVNEIYCRAAFPLNGEESDEVNAYRALVLGLQAQGIIAPAQGEIPNNQIVPQEGLVNGANDAMVSLLKENGKTPALSATNTKTASVTDRGVLRNMLAGAYGAVSGVVANYWFAIILLGLLVPTGFYAKKILDEEDDDEAEPIL